MSKKLKSKNGIVFSLERKKVKNINIRINNDLKVCVSANKNITEEQIIDVIDKRSDWILGKLEYLKIKEQSKNTYMIDNIDNLRYLGNIYEIKRKDDIEMAYLEKDIFYIAKEINKDEEVDKFYSEKSNEVFNKSLKEMYDLLDDSSVLYPSMDIKYMKSLWGSCHINKNKIVINKHLIKCDRKLIDYVILHELTHFKYKNHDRYFYKALSDKMPDHDERKRNLNKNHIRDIT